MKLVIDPGHGGYDPGAIGPTGITEAAVNLAIARLLSGLMSDAGHTVLMTWGGDELSLPNDEASVELEERCATANQAQADLFVSIHCNASDNPEAHGTETWYHCAGDQLAYTVQQYLANLGLADRGIKQGSFYVLKYTDMPAILIETAFVSNIQEEQLLAAPDFQHQAAQAIARGICEYWGRR